MGVHYDGDELFAIIAPESSFLSGVLPELQSLVNNGEVGAQNAFMSDSWKGKAAETFKQYFQDIYGAVFYSLFSDLFGRMDERMKAYLSGYKGIDGDTHAIIDTKELAFFQSSVQLIANSTTSAHSSIKGELQKIRDIVSVRYDTPSVPSKTHQIVSDIDHLLSDIRDFENTYKGDFGDLHEMISTIRETINLAKNVMASADGRNITYNPADFQKLFQKAYNVYESNQQYLQANAERIEADNTAVTAIVDQRKKELEARKALAFGLKIVVAVAAAAVTIATAGAAGPVVIAIGAGVGAASSAATSIIDQGIVGDLSGRHKIDWGEVGKEAVIGGLTGAVSSCVGAGSNALTGLFKNSSTVVKFAANVGIKTFAKIVEKSTNRFIETSIREGSVSAGWEDVKDNIAGDAAGALTGQLISETFGTVTDKIKLNPKKYGVDNLGDYLDKHAGTKASYDLIKNELKDMGKDFTSEWAKTGDISAGVEKAFDYKERIKTAAESLTESAAAHKAETMTDSESNIATVSKPIGSRTGNLVEELLGDDEDESKTRSSCISLLQSLAGQDGGGGVR